MIGKAQYGSALAEENGTGPGQAGHFSVALLAAKGAPGVTTSALLLAAVWPRPTCLVEADPSGGDLRWWQTNADGQALRPDTGVVSLLAAARSTRPPVGAAAGSLDLTRHAQQLPGGLSVLVGASTPNQHHALAAEWPQLAAALTAPRLHTQQLHGDAPAADIADETDLVDVVVDAGRLTPDPATRRLLQAMSLVLLVCRPTVSSLAHTRHSLATLAGTTGTTGGAPLGAVGVVVIGSPADRRMVRTALSDGLRAGGDGGLFVGQLADDPKAAGALAGTWTRGLNRSPLVAAGRLCAAELFSYLHQQSGAAFPPAATATAVAVDAGSPGVSPVLPGQR